MDRVVITGASGFLGSHITETLVNNNFEVIAIKRKQTDCWRCNEFIDKVTWINRDGDGEWKKALRKFKPSALIHAGWIGVEANQRDDWDFQTENISFLIELLVEAKAMNIMKIISLGSQAEYGYLSTVINEEAGCNPISAYGGVKLACLAVFKTFCELNHINWIWLRLFSFFGERENETWLIPSLISKIQEFQSMDFTEGQQRYAYMYVKDFNTIILKLMTNDVQSGIYNVSGNESTTLKELAVKIKNKLNHNFEINFGALPYRQNQSMLIQGDMTKLILQIGETPATNFDWALNSTIKYFTSLKAH